MAFRAIEPGCHRFQDFFPDRSGRKYQIVQSSLDRHTRHAGAQTARIAPYIRNVQHGIGRTETIVPCFGATRIRRGKNEYGNTQSETAPQSPLRPADRAEPNEIERYAVARLPLRIEVPFPMRAPIDAVEIERRKLVFLMSIGPQPPESGGNRHGYTPFEPQRIELEKRAVENQSFYVGATSEAYSEASSPPVEWPIRTIRSIRSRRIRSIDRSISG